MDKINLELDYHLGKLLEDTNYMEKFNGILLELIKKNKDQAEAFMTEAVLFAKKNKFKLIEGHLHATLGWFYNDNCQFQQGIESHTLANNIFEEFEDIDGITNTCNGLMYMYFMLGMYNSSIEWGVKGLNLAEKTHNKKHLQIILGNIAQNYIRLEQFEEAKQALESLNAIEEEKSPVNQIIFDQIKAEIHVEYGEFNQAIQLIKQALARSTRNNYKILIAESYRIKGNIEYRQNNFEVAKKDFEQAYKISTVEKFSEIEMNTLFDWGKLLFVAGEYEKSEMKLLKAFSIAQEYTMPLSFKKISDQLILLYKEVKNYELALHFYEVYQEYEKTLELKRSNLWGAKLKHEKSISEARLFKDLYDEIFLISNIGLVLTSKLSYDKLLIKVHDELSKLMDVSIFGITELNEEENRLEYALYHQLGDQIGKGIISFDDETSLGVYCIKNKRNILMNDIQTEYTKFIPKKEEFKIVSEGMHSIIMCPLIVHDEVKGFITVQSTQKSAYTQNDLNKTKLLASYVAIAIENAKLYRQTKYYASHDGLTGVYNRVVCLRKAENMLKKSRNKTPLSVIMLDIDYFKKINDSYGHQIGDQVLIQVGQLLHKYSHKNIVIGRYGGEEFLIFLQNYNHIQAKCFAEKIRMEISNCLFFINKSKNLSITASLGVYEYPNSTITLDQGIYYADAALYRSKQKGRNIVSTFA